MIIFNKYYYCKIHAGKCIISSHPQAFFIGKPNIKHTPCKSLYFTGRERYVGYIICNTPFFSHQIKNRFFLSCSGSVQLPIFNFFFKILTLKMFFSNINLEFSTLKFIFSIIVFIQKTTCMWLQTCYIN